VQPASAIIAMAPEIANSWRIYISPKSGQEHLHWHIDEGQAADICEWPELVHWHRRRNRSADMIDVPHGKYIGGAWVGERSSWCS
jgi:hypothetical protein